MTLEWIDILEPETGRTSSLGISDKHPETLQVTGVLTHNSRITLKTADDATRLRAWLHQNFPAKPRAVAIPEDSATDQEIYKNIADIIEADGDPELAAGFAPVIRAMRGMLDTWTLKPAKLQKCHDKLYSELTRALDTALALDALVANQD